MSYRLEENESLGDGIKRIAIEQLDGAIERLAQPMDDGIEAVHTARKGCKKVRALLRLMREEIGDEIYHRESNLLRDVARCLADARDADSALEALEKLH